MYTGLKHLHILLTSLFVLSFLIKTILLFVNEEKLQSFRKKTRVLEMVITMLFLITGVIMIGVRGAGYHHSFWEKLSLVIIAIPLGIIGFKKSKKVLVLLSCALFILTIGMALRSSKNVKQTHVEVSGEEAGSINHGAKLYQKNCTTCHGETGASANGGAADLSAGPYKEAYEIANVVESGVGNMPSFNKLDSLERIAIGKYVLTLKK